MTVDVAPEGLARRFTASVFGISDVSVRKMTQNFSIGKVAAGDRRERE